MTGKAIIFYHVFIGERLIHHEIKNTDTYQLTFNGSFKFKNQTRLVIGWKTGQTKLYYTTVQKRWGPFTFNLGNENVKKSFCMVRLSLHMNQVAHQAGAYPGVCSMKRLVVFSTPPLNGMLVHRRVTNSIKGAVTPGWRSERPCESQVSCPSTQHNVPRQNSNPDISIWS